ncbi:membrane protein [Staphylococcus schleiferi]|uniref:ABC transporter permease n=1 Tax=Staphylococcus coagulans TaxID=74706 RepID=UPI00067A3CB1|nr:ABC transporter permease [Staphylococcus coagulans]AKS68084.1 membrane protein [Staphylococcus schleiferi]AKS70337.1 membrane protein [Staphylococcus schleiferi]AKS72455.1 membrane protein [Staphylococcus schleiferi]MBA8764277.1 ABC transporter permease subunit [Staphylococcus coagulans]MBT2810485.1 ABC transporter permease [Staphylococcus coagulans]
MNKQHQQWLIWGSIGLFLISLILYVWFQPNEGHPQLQSPNFSNLLGTDQRGRDFLVRLIIGSGVTLSLTACVVYLSVTIGLIMGLTSAMLGRWVDKAFMFIADMLLAIPSFIIALVVLSFLSDSVFGLVFALTIGWVGRYLRYFRNLARDLQKRPFVQFAVLSGYSKFQTTMTHIMPHMIRNIFALVTADFGKMMLSISGLAFLGLGLKPPTPELGTILFDGKSYFNTAPWLFFYPGLLLGGYALICQLLNKKYVQTMK